jgi:hypothetical protein
VFGGHAIGAAERAVVLIISGWGLIEGGVKVICEHNGFSSKVILYDNV